MSTRSHYSRDRHIPPTDPRWYPTTRGIAVWLNRMADRRDLAVRVLKGNLGAPARFVPPMAEIDFSEALLSKVDPTIAGSPDFVIKHPALAGAGIHEAGHARSSTMDLPAIVKRYGNRHSAVLAMLEEARCETQLWPHLSEVEKAALQSMVLDIVIKDALDASGDDSADDDDDDDYDPLTDPRTLLRLVGLMAGRVNTGIVDLSHEKTAILWQHVIDTLGQDVFDTFNRLAVRFSRISTSSRYDDRYLDDMHQIVREWIEATDALFPPPPRDEDQQQGSCVEGGSSSIDAESEPSKGGGESPDDDESDDSDDDSDGAGDGSEGEDDESDSDGGGAGDDESDDESDEAGDDGEGDDGDDTDEGESSKPTVGDDDEGEVGDGSDEITDRPVDDNAGLGDYASSHVRDAIKDIFNKITEAAEEQKHISGSRLRKQHMSLVNARAADHAQRRRLNQEWSKKW